jgi:hypothetical protein
VKAVFSISVTGISREAGLPVAPEGLRTGPGGESVPFVWDGDAIRSADPEAALPGGGHQSDLGDCELIADWKTAKVAILKAGQTTAEEPNVMFGRHDIVTINQSQGLGAMGLESGVLIRASCVGSTLERFDLPARVVSGALADGWGANRPEIVSMTEAPEAVAVSDSGVLAFSDTAGRVAIIK